MFSTSEVLGLVMAVLQGWHGSAEADHPAAIALAKIPRVLPASTAAAAEAMRHIQAQNPSDKAAMPNVELTATITRACQNQKRIRVTYRTGSRMVLDPWPSSYDTGAGTCSAAYLIAIDAVYCAWTELPRWRQRMSHARRRTTWIRYARSKTTSRTAGAIRSRS